MKRPVLFFLPFPFLSIPLAATSLVHQGHRAVRVEGRQPAVSGQRVTLGACNSSHGNIGALRNPVNDARDMAGPSLNGICTIPVTLKIKSRVISI